MTKEEEEEEDKDKEEEREICTKKCLSLSSY
jgi:hypothetical protein